MQDKINITGSVKIEVKHDGKVVNLIKGRNLVVNTGKALIASRLRDATDAAVSHMACGDSSQLPAEGDTALVGTEHERVAGTVTVTNNVISVAATFGAGITGTVTMAEYALFNAGVAGDMLARFTTSPQSLNNTAGDTFDVTWTLQFGD